MKVLVAAASFGSMISGIQRHAFNMVSCLLRTPEVESVHFAVAPWQEEMVNAHGLQSDPRVILHVREMGRSSIGRNTWHYRRLPELARSVSADLVHLTYPVPINAPAFHCPVVATLHDMYPFEIPMNFGFPKFIFNQLMLRQCLSAADAIACVSETTMGKLRSFVPSVSRKALRIYNCVEPHASSEAACPIAGLCSNPFLLCVAQHRKNKNLPLLIRAYRRLLNSRQISTKTQLIIVGVLGPETGHIRRVIGQTSGGRIQLIQGLTEAELQWCYKHCEVLIAPSITEGFGLPVAEGLLAGCRVVCSEIPAHWEIGAGRCHFVELKQDAEERLAGAIAAGLSEPKPQPMDLPELSADHLSREYIALYRTLLTSSAVIKSAPAIPLATSERQPL